MLKRPKSAVLLSVPYNFQNKQEAVDIKQKVKKSLLTFETQQSLDMDVYNNITNPSFRSYVDNGPSLLFTTSNHYSVAEPNKTFRSFRSLQNSRASSAGFNRNLSKQKNSQLCTGLQNYQRLKPCKSINQKSVKHLQECLKSAKKQSKFIERIFQNLSPRVCQLVQKPKYKYFKKLNPKQKQNRLSVNGKSFDAFQQTHISSNFNEETPYKTKVFQPTLQRKGLQLLRKSKAYLLSK